MWRYVAVVRGCGAVAGVDRVIKPDVRANQGGLECVELREYVLSFLPEVW